MSSDLSGGRRQTPPARTPRRFARSLSSLVGRARTLVRRRGLHYIRYLVTDVAFGKLWYRLAYPSGATGAAPRAAFQHGGDWPLDALRDATHDHGNLGNFPPPRTLLDAGRSPGRGQPHGGLSRGASAAVATPPASAPAIGEEEDVVEIDGEACLRRTHRPGGEGFTREAFALSHLQGIDGVPVLRALDEANGAIYVALLHGQPLLQHLRGASPAARASLLREVDLLMHRIHARGVTRFDVSPERVIVDKKGRPHFVGFDHARLDDDLTTRRFAARRDADRVEFNRAHGTDLLTESSARRALTQARERLTTYEDYAPIDFGAGLTLGNIPTTDSGTGRWEFFNGRVVGPLVRGRRVLDLGSNNGSMPSSMLRAGAREVVAVELNEPLAALCELTVRIFEWRDMRPYSLNLQRGSMTEFLHSDWGAFDVVTAFCSLYYLSEDEMAAIVRKAASMGATVILQSNEAIDPGLRRVASARYLASLLEQNGYANARISQYCPAGYTRVLLVAHPPDSVNG